MVRRHQKSRQRLSCGHLGSGQACPYCHPVVQIDESQAPDSQSPTLKAQSQPRRIWQATGQHMTKQQWQQSFAADPIDLTHLPKSIVIKTRQILAALDQGVPQSSCRVSGSASIGHCYAFRLRIVTACCAAGIAIASSRCKCFLTKPTTLLPETRKS